MSSIKVDVDAAYDSRSRSSQDPNRNLAGRLLVRLAAEGQRRADIMQQHAEEQKQGVAFNLENYGIDSEVSNFSQLPAL